ncbi:hypothetical protein ACHQM5_017395 [Ranunculus cassubicifolius]
MICCNNSFFPAFLQTLDLKNFEAKNSEAGKMNSTDLTIVVSVAVKINEMGARFFELLLPCLTQGASFVSRVRCN